MEKKIFKINSNFKIDLSKVASINTKGLGGVDVVVGGCRIPISKGVFVGTSPAAFLQAWEDFHSNS